jgi:short-subunit dehydrogenase
VSPPHLVVRRQVRVQWLTYQAGVVSRCPTLETPLSNLREMFETNVFGPLHLIQLCTPALIRTSNNAGGGARVTPKTPGGAMILNVGSTAGEGLIWHMGYAASKVSRVLWVV